MLSKSLIFLENAFPYQERIKFRCPADASEIENMKSWLDYPITKELEELYSWHDGEEPDLIGDVAIFGFSFLCISEGIKVAQEFESMELAQGCDENWIKKFFPVGEFDGGYVLATLSNVDKQKSQIFYYLIEDGEAFLFHQGISEMVAALGKYWSSYPMSEEKMNEIRVKESPNAWTDRQKGDSNVRGVKNVFSLDNELPEALI